MKVQVKETKLTDGSKVFDVNILANSNPKFGNKCIVSCTSEYDAQDFFAGLKRLVEDFTIESFEEV